MITLSIQEARRLFSDDCKNGVFRAEVGGIDDPWRRSVNVYPRKSGPGFNYLIWTFGVAVSAADLGEQISEIYGETSDED